MKRISEIVTEIRIYVGKDGTKKLQFKFASLYLDTLNPFTHAASQVSEWKNVQIAYEDNEKVI